jgi:hypothetical protein
LQQGTFTGPWAARDDDPLRRDALDGHVLIYQTLDGPTGLCSLLIPFTAVSIRPEVVRCFAGAFGVRKRRRVKREAGACFSR